MPGKIVGTQVHYYNYSVMVSLDGHNYMQRMELRGALRNGRFSEVE